MSANWGPGTVILGRYRLDSLIGRGGMGSVWRAEHLQLRSPVAVKLLDASISGDEQTLNRFIREAQSAASLRSPHVVQIFDYGVEDGTAFMAMELLHGESLAQRVKRLGMLPTEEVVRFLSQVLRAIGKAHDSGIVHRDLKPDNVFICADEPEFAKVLDFGVAKVNSAALTSAAVSRTQTGMMIGTPYYMSPEQTQAKDVDGRADLWAIAIIAFECLLGRRPFTGDSFGELVIAICTMPAPVPSALGEVPPGFDEWFVKGAQRDRERRFGSAREMADELAKLAGISSSSARTAPFGPTAAAAQAPSTGSRPGSRVEGLELTTGQRAVTSKSMPGTAAPRRGAVYALLAAAVVIAFGVFAFVGFGGASAFNRAGLRSDAASATLGTAALSAAVRASASSGAPAPERAALLDSAAPPIVAAPSAIQSARELPRQPAPPVRVGARPKKPGIGAPAVNTSSEPFDRGYGAYGRK